MRLIDADAFKSWLLNRFAKPQDTLVLTLQGFIAEQPTAYDIDKVVEELDCDRCESCSFLKVCAGSICCRECHKKTIEIIKHGGVSDDVCEWNLDGVYIFSPHSKMFSCVIDDKYRYTYCPVCGKKIKVVE